MFRGRSHARASPSTENLCASTHTRSRLAWASHSSAAARPAKCAHVATVARPVSRARRAAGRTHARARARRISTSEFERGRVKERDTHDRRRPAADARSPQRAPRAATRLREEHRRRKRVAAAADGREPDAGYGHVARARRLAHARGPTSRREDPDVGGASLRVDGGSGQKVFNAARGICA